MDKKRKGARWLDIGQHRWSYYVGKKFVEIVNPEGKKFLVARSVLDVELQAYRCEWDCCEADCPDNMNPYDVTLPGAVARHVRANLDQR